MSALLHVFGATSQVFQVWNDKGTSSTTYKITNRDSVGKQWTCYRLRGEVANPLINLSVSPFKGIAIAIHENAPNGKSIVDPQVLLDEFYPVSCRELPNEYNADKGGSILLAVCLKVTANLATEDKGIRLNASSIKKNATAEDWTTAYQAIEERYKLPEYLREEFISVMKSYRVAIQFETEQATEQPTEQTEQVTEQATEQPTEEKSVAAKTNEVISLYASSLAIAEEKSKTKNGKAKQTVTVTA